MQEQGGPRPFDVATRSLIEADPVGWLRYLGLAVDGPVRPIDTEVSTVLAEVDKVLRVDGPPPWLAHIEFQASHDPDLPRRLLQYHAILLHRHRLPVETIVVLLRPSAGSRRLNGRFEQSSRTGESTITFRYRVVRIWEQPVEVLLNGSLGTLPLAPLADRGHHRLAEVLDRLDERFTSEAREAAGDFWAATALLMGVRYDRATIAGLIQRVRRMRESVTYQLILEEGEIREARRTVLDLGADKFGPPDASMVASVESLTDIGALHRMVRALLRATSWQELLAAGQG